MGGETYFFKIGRNLDFLSFFSLLFPMEIFSLFSIRWFILEKEMATHSGILAWRIPWKEEPGGLQSTGSYRVGHDWETEELQQQQPPCWSCWDLPPFQPLLCLWAAIGPLAPVPESLWFLTLWSISQFNYLGCTGKTALDSIKSPWL